MSSDKFPQCLEFVLAQEGGWSNNPDDPGGATNKGITLRTYQSFQHGATVDDLRNISAATVATIYRRQYWSIMGCDNLPVGVDLMVFDFGVTAGPARSVTYLQVVAGVRRDGIDGAITEGAIGRMRVSDVISRLNGMQLAHYRALPSYDTFGEGWEEKHTPGQDCAGHVSRQRAASRSTGMICPFKVSGKDGETCGDCDAVYAPDMECGLMKQSGLPGAPITAGAAAVCDPSSGICESCE